MGANWDAEIERLQRRTKQLERALELQRTLQGLEECRAPLKDWSDAALAKGEVLEERIQWYTGTNIASTCETARSDWRSALAAIETVKTSEETKRKEVGKSIEELTKLESTLWPQVEKAGFPSLNEAWGVRMQESEFERLRQQRDGFERAKSGFAVERKGLLEVRSTLQQLMTAQDEASLTQEVQALEEAIQHDRKLEVDYKAQLKLHEDNEEALKVTTDELARANLQGRKWDLLKSVIGDATGKRFNDFAQDLTLEQLLVLANKRLAGLSDRYQLSSAKEGEDPDHLYAVDLHMGNLRRSVKTLSGGETFLMSLSLALALSELASRNVEINSLFIDEGFGTLDPETLDQTMDTLERLQSESGKTVGIISHVESLKERITTQIKLDRNGQGYSSLQVV